MRQQHSADNQSEKKSRLLFVIIIGAVLLVVGGSIAAGMILFNGSHAPAQTETTAAQDGDIHAVYGDAVRDERIDNSDLGAEEAIRYYISAFGTQEKQPDDSDAALDIRATGNAMLYIYRCYRELSDEERQALAERATELKTDSKDKLAELRKKSEVKDLQLVYIFEDTDSVIAAVVCDE